MAILLLCIYVEELNDCLKEVYAVHVHCSIFHNSKDIEQLNKDVVYIDYGLLFRSEKEGSIEIGNNMDDTR